MRTCRKRRVGNSASEARLSKCPRTPWSDLDTMNTEPVEETRSSLVRLHLESLANSELDGMNDHERDILSRTRMPSRVRSKITVDHPDALLLADTPILMATIRTGHRPAAHHHLMLASTSLTHTAQCLPVDESCPCRSTMPSRSRQSLPTAHPSRPCTHPLRLDLGRLRPPMQTPTLTTKGLTLPTLLPRATTNTRRPLSSTTVPLPPARLVPATPIHPAPVATTHQVKGVRPPLPNLRANTLSTRTPVTRRKRHSSTLALTRLSTLTAAMTESDVPKVIMTIRERCPDPLRPFRQT